MLLHASSSPLWTCLRVPPTAHLNAVRHASLNSAIARGIRRSQSIGENGYTKRGSYDDNERRNRGSGSSRQRPTRGGFDEASFNSRGSLDIRRSQPMENDGIHKKRGSYDDFERPRRGYGASRPQNPTRLPKSGFDKEQWIRTGVFTPSQDHGFDFKPRALKGSSQTEEPKPRKKKPEKPQHHRYSDDQPERVKEHVRVPDTIPYTTPASEFIYGSNSVEAALRCSRRQLYKLYIYQSTNESLSSDKIAIRKLALSRNIQVKMAFGDWDRLLDKMSAGRPHNGIVLEASFLPQLPVKSFRAVPSMEETHFRVDLATQTREEAAVNGMDVNIQVQTSVTQQPRYPVALLLDGIVDPGNMGAIIRSAYFLGIDAIVFAGRNSAPLSPVTIKASAGAAENMTLMQVRNEREFILRSKENGWKFYAADAPAPGSEYIGIYPNNENNGNNYGFVTQSPSVIMMGSESDGLSSHIKTLADSTVGIPGARINPSLGIESDTARVDSLNVSVAAALLIEMFLRVPLAVNEVPQKGKDRTW